ncbi:MAG: rRNA maturation RNase YbeY [Flavobacteriales bacterium]|nr:rRNA maturation RNase YbeY [Flavobacteriales bacterium]
MSRITFSGGKIRFRKRDLVNWIRQFVQNKGFSVEQISINLVTDEDILKINETFLKHNYYTDVITFDYTQNSKLCGEIFISLDRVKENAKIYNSTFKDEFLRVLAHGLLHLMGYSDKTTSLRENMQQAENEAINLFYSIFVPRGT